MVERAERDILHEIRKGVCQGKHKDAVLVAMKELEKLKGKHCKVQSGHRMEDCGGFMIASMFP